MVSSWASPHVRGQKEIRFFYGPSIVNIFWRSYCSIFNPQYSVLFGLVYVHCVEVIAQRLVVCVPRW